MRQMKNIFSVKTIAFLTTLFLIFSGKMMAEQKTSFTYQGFLKDGNNPANGIYDFTFRLYNPASKGIKSSGQSTLAVDDVHVVNGQFTVNLDFAPVTSTILQEGDAVIEISVRPGNSTGDYITLLPTQKLTSSPYAVFASNIFAPVEINASTSSPGIGVTNDAGAGISGTSNLENNAGVIGTATSGQYSAGVKGLASAGSGVVGMNTDQSNYGYIGTVSEGVKGLSYQNNGLGVLGEAKTGFATGVKGDATGYGVFGKSDYVGVYGEHNTSKNYGWLGTDKYGFAGINNVAGGSGAFGESTNVNGYGVYGQCDLGGGQNNYGYLGGKNVGVYGEGTLGNSVGVKGVGYTGVSGVSNSAVNSIGVQGSTDSEIGVAGMAGSLGVGIYGYAVGDGRAGLFAGNVEISGKMTASDKDFKIDHPLDPENKFLYHSSVESPERKNIYDGIATTDEKGIAVVALPDYFEALNENFRYQLTVIGDFCQAVVSREIADNQFEIKTEKPNIKVCWQVTGARKDAYAKFYKMVVEEEKSPNDKGKYLSPIVFGKTMDKGIDYNKRQMGR